MPPPSGTPGNASRAAAKIASAGGQAGQTLPGRVHFRSQAGDTDTRAKRTPALSAAARTASRSRRMMASSALGLPSSWQASTASSTNSAPVASPIAR